jgi:6-phosphogluconate dehydrogenase
VNDVKAALYASKVCSYAQGMALLQAASREFGWGLQTHEIARIWKGGCIIRASFLDRITKAYRANKTLPNLLMDQDFAREVKEREDAWRRVIVRAVQNGLPVPAFTASLAYFDTYRRARVPANLIQAQRDFFGAHTFERIDMSGSFHAEWSKL